MAGSSDVRILLKRAAEIALCRAGVARVASRIRRHDVLVLAYHNVVPERDDVVGERTLHTSQEMVHRQLTMLSRTHDFINVDRINEPGTGRARVAVTFDDAYRGAVELGGEVLEDLDIPATIFVAPACLGGQLLWWDQLSREMEMEPSMREVALTAHQGKSTSVLDWAAPSPNSADIPTYYRTATEAQLDAALAVDSLTLGSHTWSHPNLTTLDAVELAEELERSIRWLRERYPARTCDWLSYPYGRSSPAVASAAQRAGYRGAFRIDGGLVPEYCDPFAIPRLNVPAGLSVEGLELRCSGLVKR
jgi:peptidoglycan/xylan/chitin deacetylase (PgdA/CDA1 family)